MLYLPDLLILPVFGRTSFFPSILANFRHFKLSIQINICLERAKESEMRLIPFASIWHS